VQNGVVLTGGGALIKGLDKYLSDMVKLPVYVGDEPLLAVAKGTGEAIQDLDLLSRVGFSE
ncbi:rod shape-determining protein, partial [Helicobacter pylori]